MRDPVEKSFSGSYIIYHCDDAYYQNSLVECTRYLLDVYGFSINRFQEIYEKLYAIIIVNGKVTNKDLGLRIEMQPHASLFRYTIEGKDKSAKLLTSLS